MKKSNPMNFKKEINLHEFIYDLSPMTYTLFSASHPLNPTCLEAEIRCFLFDMKNVLNIQDFYPSRQEDLSKNLQELESLIEQANMYDIPEDLLERCHHYYKKINELYNV